MVVTKHLLVFLIWNMAVGAVLLTGRPEIGLPWALGLYLLLLWGYILKPLRGSEQDADERESVLLLRPLRGQALFWTIVAVPVVLFLSWALGDVYSYLVEIPPDTLNPFEPAMQTAVGRLAIAVFAIGVAPVVEELVFRGLIQGQVARSRGVGAGIVFAGALFAAIHLLPHIFPLHFFLGLAFGFAVYATGSIWTGVILHAANNATAMLGIAFAPAEQPEMVTVWQSGITPEFLTSVLLLAFMAAVAVWTGRRLFRAGESSRLPEPDG